jgi:DNA-binding NarL/FixJ family response regulator
VPVTGAVRIVVASDLERGLRSRLEAAGVEVVARARTADAFETARRAQAEAVVVSIPAAASLPARERPPTGSPAVPAALSDRELEVLRLVAEGKGNTEIAAALVISPKTVKNHLSHILAKLGLRNRVQAAVYAVRAGLTEP